MQPFAGPTSMDKLGPTAPVTEGAAAQSEEETIATGIAGLRV